MHTVKHHTETPEPHTHIISEPLEVHHMADLEYASPVTYIPLASAAVRAVLGDTRTSGRKNAIESAASIKTIDSLHEHAGTLRIDSMTGLATRTIFDNDYPRFIDRARVAIEHGSTRATVLILSDLDNLKKANDLDKDHQKGDLYIKTAAEAIRAAGRPGDSMYRIGGDEFAEVIVDIDPDILEDGSLDYDGPMARIIDQRSSKANLAVSNIEELTDDVHAGVSFGYAVFKADDTTETFFGRADDMLYLAKEAKKQQV